KVAALFLSAFLCGSHTLAQGSTGVITGKVIDSTTRQPIVSAAVAVTGTTLGALSRADGGFTINGVPAGAQRVRITRIGYGPQDQQVTVTAGSTSNLDVALSAIAANLSAVVVTGYGTQRREAITGSVSTVDGSDANKGVIANANQLVQGRVP